MSSLSLIFVVFVEFLAITRGSNAPCSNIHNDINSPQVATMCTDSVVTGSSVFIDTSHARNMSLTSGSICTCHAQLGEGTFNVIANFTDSTDSSSCGTYLKFHTDGFSSNIACATNTLDPVFQNVTVGYHTVSESVIGGYCVNLKQDICADDGFKCTDGTCLPGDVRCNNIEDCLDGSDEEDCGFLSCPEGQVRCDNGTGCIQVEQRCDGTVECLDGSDELLKYCGNGTVINEPSPATEKSYITITCLKYPASQVSTATPAATALPTTNDVRTTTHHSDFTSSTPATTTFHTGTTLTVTDPPDTSDDNIGLIIGPVIGGLAMLAVIIGVIVFCWQKQK